MSKNSPKSNYECLKSYIQIMETKRRKNQQQQAVHQPRQVTKKYHPALKYNGE